MESSNRFRNRFRDLMVEMIFCLVLISIGSWTPAAAGAEYTVVDLGTVADRQPGAGARSVNNHEQVAGTILIAAPGHEKLASRAALLSRNGPKLLSEIGEGPSRAAGINDANQIVGAVLSPAGVMRACVWKGGKVHIMGGNALWPSSASGINRRGDVVGEVQSAPDRTEAVRWALPRRDLERLDRPDWRRSSAEAINDFGVMVGYAVPASDVRRAPHAVVWHGSYATLLPGLSDGLSLAIAVNASGDTVGMSETRNRTLVGPHTDGNPSAFNMQLSARHAVLWHAGRVRDLGVLAGFESSEANSINRAGLIVGELEDVQHRPRRAFLWRKGRMYLLDTLISRGTGWSLESARSVNDRGEICGVGALRGVKRDFLLVPRMRH